MEVSCKRIEGTSKEGKVEEVCWWRGKFVTTRKDVAAGGVEVVLTPHSTLGLEFGAGPVGAAGGGFEGARGGVGDGGGIGVDGEDG